MYPGLAVAEALRREVADRGIGPLELLYVGVRGRIDERIVPAAGLPFRAVSSGQLRVSSPLTFVRNLARLALGSLQALRLLRAQHPAAVFATGGYASVPVGLAARILRRPLVVYLPDVTPGWAVRLLSRLATRMATTSDRALAHLPARKTSVVGYPVRDDFWTADRNSSRAKLGLSAEGHVLLVTGASLGARAINDAIFDALPALLDRAQLLHVTGADDEARAIEHRDALPQPQRARYHVRGYLADMPDAMVAADLAVSRAGASVLGELPAAGLPAILVPGEYEGWTQAPNAEYLQSEGAAVMLRNADLLRLADTVVSLLEDAARLARMREAARRLAHPDAARDLARLVLEAAA